MGNISSFFSVEPIPISPTIIKADPPYNVTVHAVIRPLRRIGTLFGNYFSVHEGIKYPPMIEAQSSMWLWLRKIHLQNNFVSIDLENFHRGVGGDCTRGKVLYNVILNVKPKIDSFTRVSMTNQTTFSGFINNGNQVVKNDLYYINHIDHLDQIKHVKLVRYNVIYISIFYSKET
jgi:hypothetical protein